MKRINSFHCALAFLAIASFSSEAQIYISSGLGESIDIVSVDGRGHSTLIDLNSALGEAASYYNTYGITISGAMLYWIDGGPNAIYTADLDGGNIRKLIDLTAMFGESDYHDGGITVSGSQLFWAHWSENRIFTAQTDGSNPRVLVDATAAFGRHHRPLDVASSGTHLFWTAIGDDYKNIYTAKLDGSNPRKLIDSAAVFGTGGRYLPQGIVVSGSRLYWTDVWLDAICTAGLDGSNPRILIDLEAVFGPAASRNHYAPGGIVVSGSQLIWSDRGEKPRLYSAALTGADPRVLMEMPSAARNQPHFIAVQPVVAPVTPEIRRIETTGDQIQIDFTGILQQSSDLRSWIDISPQPTNPHRLSPTARHRFFRARSQ